MRRLMVVLLVAAISLIATTDAQAYYNNYKHYQKIWCRFKRNDHWSHTEVFDTYQCIYDKIDPNDKGIAGVIGERESHFTARAKNPSSSASGVYQFVHSTWVSDYRLFRKRDRHWGLKRNVFNARSNIFIAAYVMRRWGCGAWSEIC